MKHTYATGAPIASLAQYAVVGGTDSLSIMRRDTTGTVSVVANTSSYGANAIQVTTSATASESSALYTTATSGQNEFRAHFVMDMPTLSAGQWLQIASVYSGIEAYISITQAGSFQLYINGVNVHDSGTGKLPTVGTKIRISFALSTTTWVVALYNDDTSALISTGNGATAAFTGNFGNLSLGKTAWQSGTNVTMLFRAIRLEIGPGCRHAVLPAESLLTPAKGSSIVPIRLISSSGSAPVPAGATAVTNLSDGSNATSVVVQAASGIRVALRPMAVVSSDVVFLLPDVFADAATTLSVRLWKPDGSQVGSTKSVSVTTSATTPSATFTASEMSGLASTDWEAMELEVIVP